MTLTALLEEIEDSSGLGEEDFSGIQVTAKQWLSLHSQIEALVQENERLQNSLGVFVKAAGSASQRNVDTAHLLAAAESKLKIAVKALQAIRVSPMAPAIANCTDAIAQHALNEIAAVEPKGEE
jgi:hypothetical protein